MDVMEKNKKIVEEFYSEYFRAPRSDEFVDCGGDLKAISEKFKFTSGNLKKYNGYGNFLKSIGYKHPGSKANTYEVVNSRGKVIFVGTSKDIAEEFDVHPTTVNHHVRLGHRLKREYNVRLKPYIFKSERN